MEIIVAKDAGYCFGVKRAVEKVYEYINKTPKKIYTLGPVIHNPQVILDLQNKGVTSIDNVDNLPDNSFVIIRTHGVGKSTYTELLRRNIEFFDATCPFVTKIQNIAQKSEFCVIVGDKMHPEVIGIQGHCDKSVVVQGLDELIEMLKNDDFFKKNNCTLVSQTTFSKENFKKISEYVKNNYTNAIIFDTICNATQLRQKQAEEISKNADVVLIIGGKNSSNTTKLYEICKGICKKSYHIENSSEIPFDEISKANIIGITAGASTPDEIIKEVIYTMTDVNTNKEFSFEEALEQSLRPINNGDLVKGIVVAVAPNEISIDLGAKQAGFITASEYSFNPGVSLVDSVKIGDELEVVAIRVNDVEGTIMLSRKRVEAIQSQKDVEKALESGEPLEGYVTSVVNSGIIADHKGTKVFIPASQSGISREGDLNTLLNKKVDFKVIDVKDGKRKRYIGSIKKVSKEKVMSNIEVGNKLTGTVKSFTNYGAFIDIGGIDGMVHISELSWKRIKHPSDVLTLGQEIEVYIKDYNPENKRISLGYKIQGENPFALFLEKYKVGDVVDVKIERILPFGAFALITENVEGLIHISQVANVRVNRITDFIKVSDIVPVKILDIDAEKQKISLSRKVLLEDYVEEVAEEKTSTDAVQEIETEQAPEIQSKEE